jgi:hypothetical protein
MARLKALSGDQVAGILSDFGYTVKAQRGVYVKMSRARGSAQAASVTFPRAKEMDRLTLTAIFHEAAQHVSVAHLRIRFYEE